MKIWRKLLSVLENFLYLVGKQQLEESNSLSTQPANTNNNWKDYMDGDIDTRNGVINHTRTRGKCRQ